MRSSLNEPFWSGARIVDLIGWCLPTATQGLLLFRRGHADEGRLFYRRAIEEAKKRGYKKSNAVAAIYLAREEILSRSHEIESAIESAIERSKNISDPDVKEILKRVLEM